MKPRVIIAVSVGLSVVAVIGVLVAWQGVAMWQAQIAFDEYQERVDNQQMKIVQNINNVIDNCAEKFEYGNVQAKQACEDRTLEQWSDRIWELDEEHRGMIKSATTYEEWQMYLGKISDKYSP